MDVGVTEVSRVAAWALRGLGMAFGVANRAAPLVSWAEAVEGGALQRLREITPQIDGPQSNAWRSRVSDAAWRFDMSGRSLLELGPVAIDLLTMAARTGKVGRVDLLNTLDPIFLSGLARIAARRGIGFVALSAGPQLSLCGQSVSRLHAFAGPKGPLFSDAGVGTTPELDDAVEACVAEPAPAGSEGARLSLLSYAPGETPASYLSEPVQFHAERKFAFAEAHGVKVERRDLEHLYELEIRTWAPTSDRSRSQALV
jgi:hypothetical protein